MMIGARERRRRLVVFLLGARLRGVSVAHYPGGAIPGEAIDIEKTFHVRGYDVLREG